MFPVGLLQISLDFTQQQRTELMDCRAVYLERLAENIKERKGILATLQVRHFAAPSLSHTLVAIISPTAWPEFCSTVELACEVTLCSLQP